MKIYLQKEDVIGRWQWGDPAMRNLTNVLLRVAGQGPGRAVDVGCGSGRVAIALARRGFEVTGIDCERKVLGMAERIAADARVRVNFRLIDFESSTGGLAAGAYDLAVCAEVLEHVKDPAAAVENIRRLLKKGGRLILTVPKDQKQYTFLDELGGHLRRFTKEEVEDLLGGFRIIDYFTVGWPCMRSLVWLYTRLTEARRHDQAGIWSGSPLNRLLINAVYCMAKFDNLFNRLGLGTNMVFTAVKHEE